MLMSTPMQTAGFLEVVHNYNTEGATGYETIPTGAHQVVIKVWGGGGAGGNGSNLYPGQGGGGGAIVEATLTLTPSDYGKTFFYSVGYHGYGYPPGYYPTYAGTASTVSSGTKTIVTRTAGGGEEGYSHLDNASATGLGGTASGDTGDTLTDGTTGSAGSGSTGGSGGSYGGGTGGNVPYYPGLNGQGGYVRFTYT